MTYSEPLAARLRAILISTKGLEEKKLFGGVGFLVRGNMACGVHGDELILRLSDSDYAAVMKTRHARAFDIGGRPMKGWVLVAKDGYKSEATLKSWVQRAVSCARSLPAK
jgi:TfoX/Sxy family transcriptional regulator of competence genes